MQSARGDQRIKCEGVTLPTASPKMKTSKPTAVSLFTGAGGFDLGLEDAGYEIRACVEIDSDAKLTLKQNRPDWHQTTQSDVEKLSSRELLTEAQLRRGELDLLFGGPPCQPFSKSGFWREGGSKGLRDPRAQTLKAMLKHCRVILPRVLLIENVEGLGYGKDAALKWIVSELHRINRAEGTNYEPKVLLLDAADYGVAQRRRRMFLVAHRAGKQLTPPAATHSELVSSHTRPFVTAWDALADLDSDEYPEELKLSGKWADLLPSIPEGENYLYLTRRGGGTPVFGWRTRYWSFLLKLSRNRPAWTIQAQPGPATGPFHWRNRRLSSLELARLQSFPESFQFCGSQIETRRQIGNAVPPLLAKAIGQAIRVDLLKREAFDRGKLIPFSSRTVTSASLPARPVPKRYIPKSVVRDHPGTGRGPQPNPRSD